MLPKKEEEDDYVIFLSKSDRFSTRQLFELTLQGNSANQNPILNSLDITRTDHTSILFSVDTNMQYIAYFRKLSLKIEADN